MIIWKPIKPYSKRGVVKSSIPIFKYERYTPSDGIEYKLSCAGRLYAEEITMSYEKPKKLNKTAIKFYAPMVIMLIMCFICAYIQHILIFILCEFAFASVAALIIRRRIKNRNFNKR